MTISYSKVTLIYDCEHQTWPLDCMKINNGVKCIIYRSFSLIVIFQRSRTYVRLVALPRPLKWSIIRPNLLLAMLMGKVMWSAVSVCFHCSFWTNRSSILIFCVCMCHDHSLPKVETQSHRSRSRVSKDGNVVNLASVHGGCQFIFWLWLLTALIGSDVRYGDIVDNTVEENSSVFSLIQTRWLPSARACGQ